MSTKFKALALGLVAMLTLGAFGVMNASASKTDPHRGGHFVSNAPSGNTIIEAFEQHKTTHNLEFSIDNGPAIECNVTNYKGTASGNTVEQVTVTPEYDDCFTTASEDPVEVTTNGCDFEFTVNTAPATSHNAVHIEDCEKAEGISVHHPNCTITIPEQTVTGVTYKNVRENPAEKHEVTLTATVTTLNAQYHGGICIFLGTNHKGEMKGSATVKGFDHVTGNQIDITAT